MKTICLIIARDSDLFFARQVINLLKRNNIKFMILCKKIKRDGLTIDTVSIVESWFSDIEVVDLILPYQGHLVLCADLVLISNPNHLKHVTLQYDRIEKYKPKVLAFSGGIDFTPFKGFKARRFANSLGILPTKHMRLLKGIARLMRVELVLSHPYSPKKNRINGKNIKNIVFLHQLREPLALSNMKLVCDYLNLLAEKFDGNVWVQVRKNIEGLSAHPALGESYFLSMLSDRVLIVDHYTSLPMEDTIVVSISSTGVLEASSNGYASYFLDKSMIITKRNKYIQKVYNQMFINLNEILKNSNQTFESDPPEQDIGFVDWILHNLNNQ